MLSVSFEVLFQLFLLLCQSFGWFVINIGEQFTNGRLLLTPGFLERLLKTKEKKRNIAWMETIRSSGHIQQIMLECLFCVAWF